MLLNYIERQLYLVKWYVYVLYCPYRTEMIKNVLDVINVLVATPKSQLALLESVPMYNNISTPAIR